MRKILKRLRRDIRIAGLCGRVAPFLCREYFAAFARAVRICDQERLTPDEAFLLGLFRNDIDEADRWKILSRKKLTKFQKSVNPASWAPLLKNKSIFYRYCMLHGIPAPALYAVFFRDIAGWCSCAPNVINGREDWIRYIARELPCEFVVKPSISAHSVGVGIFVRNCGGYMEAGGRGYDARGVWRFLWDNCNDDGYVIQERIANHPRIQELTGSEFLQTIRVVTYAAVDGSLQILHAHLKLTLGENVTDNFGDGLSGNLQGRVDLTSGRLEPPVRLAADGTGIMVMERHPETGIAFKGYELPFWRELCELVSETAKQFVPVRTIGWDVAVSPMGPVIIEGNIWWDPHNQHQTMDRVRECFECSPVAV